MSAVSWLFVPGNDARKMDRAAQSGADALILDLEDAVAPEDKAQARALVTEALRNPAPVPRWVRINALGTGLAEADLAAVLPAGPAGIMLPKCEGPEDLDRLAELMGGQGRALPVVAIATETVRALRQLMRRDWSHPLLHALAWGGEDLAADLGAIRNRGSDGRYLGPFSLARDTALLAAHEAGVEVLDAVFTDFRDAEGLRAEAEDAAALGFTGKMAIHPAQIPVIQKAFTPDPARVDWAYRVISAMEGGGVAQLDGIMLDRPHLRQARRILARAAHPNETNVSG
ncbi:MAG: CoA ester lyase [Pararhodobacter sp.]|nr:CoA ester lyase [Pararhodobacter sp.]